MGKQKNRIGTWFLLGALGGFLVVNFQPWLPLDRLIVLPGLSLKRLLSALFDAALVGALADWFAVSALFRDPLGFHLPHTNILAKNKDNIAEAVPRFLSGFVSNERITMELAKLDFAGKFEEALSSPAVRGEVDRVLKGKFSTFLAAYSSSSGPKVEGLRGLVRDLCAFAAESVDPAPAVAGLIEWARREGFDQRVLDGVVDLFRSEMGRNRVRLAAAITPIVKRNAGWKGLFIGRGTIEELMLGIEEELANVRADRKHELRAFVMEGVARYAADLAGEGGANGAGERERLASAAREVLTDEGFTRGLADFLADLLSRLGFDLGKADSRFLDGLARAEDGLVAQLRADPDLRDRFNATVSGLIATIVVKGNFIGGLSAYMAGLLKATDPREFVDRIEESVWNDLQYIRVNGAVVGGLVGLALAVLESFLPA